MGGIYFIRVRQIYFLITMVKRNRNVVLENLIVEAIPQFPSSSNFDVTCQVQFILNNQAVASAPFKMLNSTIPTQLSLHIRMLGKRIPHILFPLNTTSNLDIIRIQLGDGIPTGGKVRFRITTLCGIFPQNRV